MHSQRGIHPPYEVFYIEAMLFKTSSALTSVESINATLEAIAEDQAGELFQRFDHRALLDELQKYRSACGCIVTIFLADFHEQ